MARPERALRSRIHLAVDELAELDRELARILVLLDRDVVLRETTRLLTENFGFHAAWIAERTDEGARIRHTSGTTPQLQGLFLRKGYGLGGKVFALGAVEWVDDYIGSRAITHHYDGDVERERIQSMIAAPIGNGEGQPIGVLLGGLRDGSTFGNRAAGILGTVAGRTGQALLAAERARHAAEVAVHEERQRMALDLHDTIGAMLFAISAGVRSVTQEANIDEALQERLLAIERQAGEAAVTLRESLRALRTSPDELALGAALQAACRKFEERTRVSAQLIMLDVLQPLTDNRVKVLIAAAKEGLLNVEKHAKASKVVVTVASMREGVAMTVTDDGAGFSPEPPEHQGFGLDAIGEALQAVGGHLTISEDGEGGVSFRAWVPY